MKSSKKQPTKPAVMRIVLDVETTERLDRVRQATMGEVSRTKAATHIIKMALDGAK